MQQTHPATVEQAKGDRRYREADDRGASASELAAIVTATARKVAAAELLAAFEDAESSRWVEAKLRFLDVVSYRPGDRAYFAGGSGWLHSGEVVERIDEDRVRIRFDDVPGTSVVPVAELCPITAELLVAAGEVLDMEPEGAGVAR